MSLLVRFDDRWITPFSKLMDYLRWILGILRLALTVTVDTFPCLRMSKGQLIWSNSDDISILIVEFFDFEAKVTAEGLVLPP